MHIPAMGMHIIIIPYPSEAEIMKDIRFPPFPKNYFIV